MEQSLTISIKSPDGIFFEGQAQAITSTNVHGPFDILPFHANFISIIKKQITIHQKNNQIKEIPITSAVLKVTGNKVDIFLGLETF